MAELITQLTTIGENGLGVYNPVRKDMRIVGVLEYVAAEVLVSKIFRSFINAPSTWTNEMFIHLLSLPFIGGLGAPYDDGSPVKTADSYAAQFEHASRGIPAVFAAQYIASTFGGAGFFHMRFDMKDMLITAGAKLMTRPLLATIQSMLPKDAMAQADVLQELFAQQAKASNLNFK